MVDFYPTHFLLDLHSSIMAVMASKEVKGKDSTRFLTFLKIVRKGQFLIETTVRK